MPDSDGHVDSDHEHKARPILVVSRDDLNRGNSVLAVPFYSQQLDKRKSQPYCVYFAKGDANLAKDCVAKCDEVQVIDKLRINLADGPIGRADANKMKLITRAIRWTIRDDELTSRP